MSEMEMLREKFFANSARKNSFKCFWYLFVLFLFQCEAMHDNTWKLSYRDFFKTRFSLCMLYRRNAEICTP